MAREVKTPSGDVIEITANPQELAAHTLKHMLHAAERFEEIAPSSDDAELILGLRGRFLSMVCGAKVTSASLKTAYRPTKHLRGWTHVDKTRLVDFQCFAIRKLKERASDMVTLEATLRDVKQIKLATLAQAERDLKLLRTGGRPPRVSPVVLAMEQAAFARRQGEREGRGTT
jgi:hypothetical protein